MDSVAKGQQASVEPSCVDVTSERSPSQPFGQVENFALSLGHAPGELDGRWNALPRKMAYEGQWTLTSNDAASWKLLALNCPTRSRPTLRGLPKCDLSARGWEAARRDGTELPPA